MTHKAAFIHGADSSALEWRFLLKRLGGEFECYAVDWWSGGWTDRDYRHTGSASRHHLAGGRARMRTRPRHGGR